MKSSLLYLFTIISLFISGSFLYAAHTDYHCGYCHQPHRNFDPNDSDENWGVPLYADSQTQDGLPTYDLYSSHWFDKYGITVGQPNGATRLCLGCHDGSYKYGSGGTKSMTHIFGATDLKKSHPVSINYEEARTKGADLFVTNTPVPNLGSNATIDNGLLDERGYVQCSSCHDVHITGATEMMLKWDAGSEWVSLCKACHNK